MSIFCLLGLVFKGENKATDHGKFTFAAQSELLVSV